MDLVGDQTQACTNSSTTDLVFHLYGGRESQPSTEMHWKSLSPIQLRYRLSAILQHLGNSIRKSECSKLKLTLTVECEPLTTLQGLTLVGSLLASLSLGLEQISKMSKTP